MSALRTYIERQALRPGDRLPPERELSRELSVPRSAVRRMLADLEARGEIWRQVGRGTFLADPAPARPEAGYGLHDIAAATYPAEVLEVRLIIEPAAAALAAHRATPSDIEALRKAARHGGEATSYEDFEHWDTTFHRLLIAAARNGLLANLYRAIEAARAETVWGKLKRASLTGDRRRRYQAGHAAIAEAVADRDPARAEAEMRRHLSDVRDDLLGAR